MEKANFEDYRRVFSRHIPGKDLSLGDVNPFAVVRDKDRYTTWAFFDYKGTEITIQRNLDRERAIAFINGGLVNQLNQAQLLLIGEGYTPREAE